MLICIQGGMKMLTSEEVAIVLRKLETPTPKTIQFEEMRDETGERKYAQKDTGDRWWDKSTGKQKEHVVCWFARKFYSKNCTLECIKNNSNINCKECYFDKNNVAVNDITSQEDAEKVFKSMKRPEMFLWIAEALGAICEHDLDTCIAELKVAMDKNPKLWYKNVIKKYITWDIVKKRILELL